MKSFDVLLALDREENSWLRTLHFDDLSLDKNPSPGPPVHEAKVLQGSAHIEDTLLFCHGPLNSPC